MNNGMFAEGSDLLDQLKSRDPKFLTKLFRDQNPVLIKVLAANRIFGETAEDLVHQTWERFFTNLEKFEGRSELRTFLCGILFNKVREHRRAQGRMIFEEDAEKVFEQNFSAAGWWKTEPMDPYALMKSGELGTLVAKCLEGLTELQKSAFILKELEEEESPDICNVLGVSVSNLRVLLFRAKDKLRQCIEGSLG